MARRKADFKEDDVDNVVDDINEPDTAGDDLSSLRQLIFLGRKEKIVEIGGVDIKIATLTSGQQRSMMKEVMILSAEERVPSMREAILSRAVISINDRPLEDLYEGEDSDTVPSYAKKSSVISSMQFSVIEKLFIEYNGMVEDSKEEDDENLKK